jgi:hypothetical protein
LLWIGASLLGLVAVLLCVTVILLPVGIPMLMLSRRMFTRSVALMLPRAMSHPLDESRKKGKKVSRKARKKAKKKAKRHAKKAAEKLKR